MSKRKPATKSKHSRGPKIAAKAQRATQAVIRSPKDSRLRAVGAASTESLSQQQNDQAAFVDDLTTTAVQQGARLESATPLQDQRGEGFFSFGKRASLSREVA